MMRGAEDDLFENSLRCRLAFVVQLLHRYHAVLLANPPQSMIRGQAQHTEIPYELPTILSLPILPLPISQTHIEVVLPDTMSGFVKFYPHPDLGQYRDLRSSFSHPHITLPTEETLISHSVQKFSSGMLKSLS